MKQIIYLLFMMYGLYLILTVVSFTPHHVLEKCGNYHPRFRVIRELLKAI